MSRWHRSISSVLHALIGRSIPIFPFRFITIIIFIYLRLNYRFFEPRNRQRHESVAFDFERVDTTKWTRNIFRCFVLDSRFVHVCVCECLIIDDIPILFTLVATA